MYVVQPRNPQTQLQEDSNVYTRTFTKIPCLRPLRRQKQYNATTMQQQYIQQVTAYILNGIQPE